MEDKSIQHLDNMDRDSVPENGSSDSKILVNDLGYDVKGGTKQTSSIILLTWRILSTILLTIIAFFTRYHHWT